MGRRRKLRGTKVAERVSDEELVIRNRLPSFLRNAMVAPVEIENPEAEQPGDKILAFRSLRDDPLARMHCRRQIDDAQFNGGRAWQRDYEITEIGGAKAIDTTKEAVDGGRLPEALTDRQLKAFESLNRVSRALGQIGCSIVHAVLAEGRTIERVAAERGHSNQRSIDFYGRLFQECLEILAVEYQFAARSPQATISGFFPLQGVGQDGRR